MASRLSHPLTLAVVPSIVIGLLVGSQEPWWVHLFNKTGPVAVAAPEKSVQGNSGEVFTLVTSNRMKGTTTWTLPNGLGKICKQKSKEGAWECGNDCSARECPDLEMQTGSVTTKAFDTSYDDNHGWCKYEVECLK